MQLFKCIYRLCKSYFDIDSEEDHANIWPFSNYIANDLNEDWAKVKDYLNIAMQKRGKQ